MAMLVLILAGTVAIIYFTTYHELNTENRQMLELYAQQYAQYGMPEGDEDPGDEIPDDTSENDDAEAEFSSGSSEDESSADGGNEAFAQNSGSNDAAAFDNSGGELSGDENTSGQEISSDGTPGTLPESDGGTASSDDPEAAEQRRKYMVSTFYSVSFSSDGSVLEINNEDESGMNDEALSSLAQAILESGKEFGTEGDVVFLITEADNFTLVTMMDNTILGETIESLVRYTIIFGAIAVIVLFFISLLISRWIIKPLEITYRKQKQFISDAGHELKTPVSTIETNSELLSREIGPNQWLSNIRYENARMGTLVKELLDLARLENTKATHTKVDLTGIALAGILPFEGAAFERALGFEYEIAENVTINGNAMQLEELVSILVDNAVNHTKEAGQIRIRLQAGHSNAIFTVANEGEEIPKEERELIFERFYRSDSSRTDSSGSDTSHYGLGLSIAKATVSAHGGKICVDCKDGFTEFRVVLPVK